MNEGRRKYRGVIFNSDKMVVDPIGLFERKPGRESNRKEHQAITNIKAGSDANIPIRSRCRVNEFFRRLERAPVPGWIPAARSKVLVIYIFYDFGGGLSANESANCFAADTGVVCPSDTELFN